MDKQTESRKAFESWFEGWFGEDAGEHVMLGDLIYYVNDYTNSSWKSWQASRESIDVETDSHTILTHTTTAILPGYKLVPVEPTFQICEILGCKWEAGEGFPARWASMLAETNGEVI